MGICCLKGYLRDTHLNSWYWLMIKILGDTNENAKKTRFNTVWGNLVSNIASDIETRIGKWNHQEILGVLQIGMLPDGYFT